MVDTTFKAKDRYNSETEFEILPETPAVEAEGEIQFRVAFSKAIQMGILTRDKMREVLKENGIIDEEDDSKFQEAIRDVGRLEAELAKAQLASEEDECSRIATNLFAARNRMLELFLIVNNAFTNSAEGYSEVIKQEVVMAASTVVKATGQRYWKDYREYVLERDGDTESEVVPKLHAVFSDVMADKSKEMMEGCPETKYLKSVTDRMLDRAVEQAAETDKLIDQRVEDASPTDIRPEADSSESGDSKTSKGRMGKDAAKAGKVDEKPTRRRPRKRRNGDSGDSGD